MRPKFKESLHNNSCWKNLSIMSPSAESWQNPSNSVELQSTFLWLYLINEAVKNNGRHLQSSFNTWHDVGETVMLHKYRLTLWIKLWFCLYCSQDLKWHKRQPAVRLLVFVFSSNFFVMLLELLVKDCSI